ncbi:MAG: haloacid dehalogenase-like hydrolase [Burkholderiales bacterium]|nr:haloacid dehalogenase-like hydrolase [Burkholderiales bacterium]
MLIGLDFDNTIVSYDVLFHRAAQEKGLIPDGIVESKLAVRDYLRRLDREDEWTELQGYVYGARMADARAYEGVIDFMREARRQGALVAIVSHKTKHPFRGPQYDLHEAARAWVTTQLVGAGLIEAQEVFFELTKEAKLRRVGALGCDYFIDDLPEILSAPAFPATTTGILFDPDYAHAQSGGKLRFTSWGEIAHYFEPLWTASR